MATTRKPAKPRTTDTPAPVAINLDTLEVEKGNEVPFVAILAGKRLTFLDPSEIAWQDLMDLDDPDRFAETCLETEEERKVFLETPMPAQKLRRLMRGYRDHYGLGEPGNVEG